MIGKGFSSCYISKLHHGYRNELYKECVAALQGGVLLNGKDLDTVKKALEEAFKSADAKLLSW